MMILWRLARLRLIVGYTLLVIGLLGLLVPVIPDWLLLIPALAILGKKSWAGRLVYRVLPRQIRRRVFG